jgi:hypothetical protein
MKTMKNRIKLILNSGPERHKIILIKSGVRKYFDICRFTEFTLKFLFSIPRRAFPSDHEKRSVSQFFFRKQTESGRKVNENNDKAHCSIITVTSITSSPLSQCDGRFFSSYCFIFDQRLLNFDKSI